MSEPKLLPITDEEIMRTLLHQVQKAARGSVETEVTTRISVPMWRAFMRGFGHKNMRSVPKPGFSVFGSHTILVKSDRLFAVSWKRKGLSYKFEVVKR